MDLLRINTLAENTTTNFFTIAEWGLSIFVEYGKKKILFDTGAGSANLLIHNARVLGIELAGTEEIVLSHGHQDHTGGLRSVLEYIHYNYPQRKTRVICHPAAVEPKYVRYTPSTEYKFYGLPFKVEELERFGSLFSFSREPVWLDENVAVSGEIPMNNAFESVDSVFAVWNGNRLAEDTEMIDDQALYLITEKGLVVILGCAHRGIINTIHHAQKITGLEEVHMVIGGAHLADVSEDRMRLTVEELKRLRVHKLGLSHCTGLKESARLWTEFGSERFFFNNVGTVINI